jgi:hypothetical protein
MARSPKTKTTKVTPSAMPPPPPRPVLSRPPTATPAPLASRPVDGTRIRSNAIVPTAMAPSSSSRPVRASAVAAMRYIQTESKKFDSDTEGEDSDWNIDEDGVNEEDTEKLHDFFKHMKKKDKGNAPIYNYCIKVMEDEEEFDARHPHIRTLESMLPVFNNEFRQFSRVTYDEEGKPFTMSEILKHLEAGIDDDYEDDGWLVKDD